MALFVFISLVIAQVPCADMLIEAKADIEHHDDCEENSEGDCSLCACACCKVPITTDYTLSFIKESYSDTNSTGQLTLAPKPFPRSEWHPPEA